MTVDVGALLQELDIRIAEGSSVSTWLLRAPDGSAFEIEPGTPAARLTAHGVRRDSVSQRRERPRVLHIGVSATTGVVERATAGEIDILTAEPIQLIHAGRRYAAAPELPQRRPPRHRGTPAWIRWALERYLLLTAEPTRQPVIAETLRTTQQSVSRAAQALGGLVADEGAGLCAQDRARLLSHWRHEYPGPGGQEFGWYGLDPVTDLVDRAVEVARLLDVENLVSGDVAADQIAPWKLPARGRIYISGPVDLADDGFVPAPLEEANLVTCIPRDPTLWRLSHSVSTTAGTTDLAVADAAIVYWDLLMSGDQDSEEAALQISQLLLGGR
ncbi:MAG: type IV toxin-antitoxin system AbiEi family antitoxin [Nocardioides sp.]|nr:type IV toxin-antitoxin system AbiEi family antitoxin [Nocardioides sp.]